MTSSKNQSEAINATTPGEVARADFTTVASSSRKATMTATPATPCLSW
jgi:hypothetical protein